MLIDWTHWLSSVPPEQFPRLLAPILLLDVSRYALGSVAMCLWDYVGEVARWIGGKEAPPSYQHCPSVCVIVAGLNEADTIGHTLQSLLDTYPRMEVIVVDDGSSDDMAEVARESARGHAKVLVLRKPERGGKSSALNFALPFTQAEILVCVDSDSHLGPSAIWECVQPFADPQVGAVSGNVQARNPFSNLATWLQALEYLHCILVGRMLASRLGVLGIVSGAFGAYRRSAIERVMGWDVGPGEDGDLTLRLRKSGYKVIFTPDARCFTNLPTSWWGLLKQRRRWDWADVTFACRKHIDLANVFSPNFRFSNLCLLLDRWIFGVLIMFVIWGYLAWLCVDPHEHSGKQLFLCYLACVGLECVHGFVVLYYSTERGRNLLITLATPLMPFYRLMLTAVSLVAATEEIFTRRSFRDSFVPTHVREATWHW